MEPNDTDGAGVENICGRYDVTFGTAPVNVAGALGVTHWVLIRDGMSAVTGRGAVSINGNVGSTTGGVKSPAVWRLLINDDADPTMLVAMDDTLELLVCTGAMMPMALPG